MQFSLKWLQDFFQTPLEALQIAEKLTEAGLEVDSHEKRSPSFENVIVARVIETKPHPDADRLCIATVFDGKENLQIVCGAKNCRADLITALAPVGAHLLDAKGKKHVIKKGKLRGVESLGMLVSLEELGLEDQSDGIVELSRDYEVGSELAPYFTDEILEISFTPNLGHAMSHLGIAREIASHFNLSYSIPKIAAYKATSISTKDNMRIAIQDAELCPFYASRLIKNVKVGPSPLWLKLKLLACNVKSINNVVDVTNWVLHELGQPMHAFDADKIDGNYIEVTTTKQEALFQTLDGQKRQLLKDTLVIQDAQKIIAIAGVMGGANSEVTQNTTNVLLEAAQFDSSAIRRSSKGLQLYTEASKHFERGIDSANIHQALDRAAALMEQIANASAAKDNLSVGQTPPPRQITCRLAKINSLLGTQLDLKTAQSLLEKLEFQTTSQDENSLKVTVPSYRNDVHIEEDLIEEVARAYTLLNLQTKTSSYSFSDLPDSPIYQLEQKLHPLLLQQGLQEVISCDLISPEMEKMHALKDQSIEALNFMSKEQSVLRSSLLANHLTILKHNQDRQNTDQTLYEIGKTYALKGECFDERETLALTLSGRQSPYHHTLQNDPLDFFHLKGMIENIFNGLHIASYDFKKSNDKRMHPGAQAEITIEQEKVGLLGELHPSLLRKMGLKQPVFFAEMTLAPLVSSIFKLLDIQAISPYPSSERDWTLTSHEDLEIAHLLKTIKASPSRLLKDVYLLDLYRSEKVGLGKKNVTLRFVYRNDKKTISFDAVEMEHARLISEVQEKMKQLIIQPS